ncbi:MAG: hypothetical protein FJ276_33960 [Planctomycetes bacterium]|nr:hypothetical protein [Planctomycetota bacterium]
MKRIIWGALVLVAAGLLSWPVFTPLGRWNGHGLASALVLLAGGCILASPVIALRVACRWRVSELLRSICLFEIAFGLGLAVYVMMDIQAPEDMAIQFIGQSRPGRGDPRARAGSSTCRRSTVWRPIIARRAATGIRRWMTDSTSV